MKVIKRHQSVLGLKPTHQHWLAILAFTERKVEKVKREQQETLSNKLFDLGVMERVDDKFVDKRDRSTNKTDNVKLAEAIFNLSSRELSEIEKRVLNKGLRYGIKAKKS